MNKLFLIICLISMIFLCSLTKAASQEQKDSPPPLGRIRTISGSSEEGLLEACARIAKESGFYPAYLESLPEIQSRLNVLHEKCSHNENLEKTILNSIFNACKSETVCLSSKLLEKVQQVNAKSLDDLKKDFFSIS